MKSNWKKMLIASMACVALTGVSATSFAAGYSLNPEVKTATPALFKLLKSVYVHIIQLMQNFKKLQIKMLL